LPEEPIEGDKEASAIVFRLPVSGERINRRFLKTDKVGLLYDFIDSLGEKVQFEHTEGEYVIMQSMPKKLFVDKEKTLGEEGLFPRAMLQVKEEAE